MEAKIKLTKAILGVMSDVKGVEKSLNVGTGRNSYKGVSDQDVKKIIGSSMVKHKLVILPINIEPQIKVDRWEATDNYGTKMKQSILTEVKVTYLLMHESGESQEIIGYGHGVDSMDKSAGKATTYALKYALLYAFLVPTGAIDDSDNDHSDSKETPAQKTKKVEPKKVVKVKLSDKKFDGCILGIKEDKYSIKLLRSTFELNEDQEIIVNKLETEQKQKPKKEDEKGK